MKFFGISFVNGLGLTKGCEKTPKTIKKLIKINLKKIKTDRFNIKKSLESIYKEAKKILEKDEDILFLGGDHSISFPLVAAFLEKFPDGVLIVFDAHMDCMSPMKEPTNEEWLRALIEKEKINKEKIFLFGVRKIYREEKIFLKKNKLNFFNSFSEIKNKIRGPVYLSVDIDVFDAPLVPGTFYREKGGPSLGKVLNLIKKIKQLDLKAADLVEINPEKDLNFETLRLAVKIIETLK
ncbi:MAG: arginase family protein [Candidatus Pacearchaeota archaeon]|nr:arginase family protein [Candidatus Pacearchaeota archaeon]